MHKKIYLIWFCRKKRVEPDLWTLSFLHHDHFLSVGSHFIIPITVIVITKYTIDYISSLLDIDIVYFDENQLTCDWEICQKRFSHSRQLESFHHSWIEKFISDWMNESQGKGDIDDYGDNYVMGFLLKVNLMLPWTL